MLWPSKCNTALRIEPGGAAMLSQCANATCGKPFLRIREGKLFLVETGGDNAINAARETRKPVPHMERYWLCDECATVWTLISDPQYGIALVPLRRPVGAVKRMPGSLPGSLANR